MLPGGSCIVCMVYNTVPDGISTIHILTIISQRQVRIQNLDYVDRDVSDYVDRDMLDDLNRDTSDDLDNDLPDDLDRDTSDDLDSDLSDDLDR